MILEMCTAVYKKKLNVRVESGSDKHVCLMLQSYTRCLERSVSSCTGYRLYDTSTTVVSRLLPRLCLNVLEHKGGRELRTNSLLAWKICDKKNARKNPTKSTKGWSSQDLEETPRESFAKHPAIIGQQFAFICLLSVETTRKGHARTCWHKANRVAQAFK